MEKSTIDTARGPLAAPCLTARVVPMDQVHSNVYNPNHVSERRLNLLERSILADGFCCPIVVAPDPAGDYVIIDGYHRYFVMRDRLQAAEIPAVVLERSQPERMASTVRFNRARGVDQVERLADVLRHLTQSGLDDVTIAQQLGMEFDEVYRLAQIAGIADSFANVPYSRAWDLTEG